MRVLVTGSNPVAHAILAALVKAGHNVRAFGGAQEDLAGLPTGPGTLSWYPGDVQVGGQVEPALSERQALVHVANLDAPGPGRAGRHAHALRIERGTRYARYGAEREQVDDFLLVAPAAPERAFAASHNVALQEARATRGTINVQVIEAGEDVDAAARAVVQALERLPQWGKQPGRENDAVTA